MRVAIGELGMKDIYKFYKAKVKNPVDYSTFTKICYRHNQLMMEEVIDKGMRVRLPYRLGYLWVKKSKMSYKRLTLDYEEFNRTGLKVFHLNIHSDDFKARLLWEKSKAVVRNKRPYCFQPTREWKRSLAKVMKSEGGHKRYFEKK